MDDLHFIERLERVSFVQIELALTLYRDPELVRWLLSLECHGDAERIAISLDHDTLGPFVVVARNGHFVTCLASGMRTHLPVVTRARLDALRREHLDTKLRLAFLDVTDDRSVVRLWRIMLGRAHRVPREVMTTLMMISPLLGSVAYKHLGQVLGELEEDLRECNRLVARFGHWSARDLDLVERIWRSVWNVGHLILLDHAESRDALERRVRRGIEMNPLAAGMGGVFDALGVPFAPVQIRIAWALTRIGPLALEPGWARVELVQKFYPDPSTLTYALAAATWPDDTLRAELARRLLVMEQPVDGTQSVARMLAATLTTEASTLADAREALLRNGRILRGLPDLDAAETAQEAARPSALPLIQLGLTGYANLFGDGTSTIRRFQQLLSLLPMLQRCEGDELYWSEVDLGLEAPFEAKHGRDLVANLAKCASVMAVRKTTPRRVARTIGRNDPCACGSGKKHKRCCGA